MKPAALALFAMLGSALAGCTPTGPQMRQVCEVAERRASYAGWTLVLEGYLLASRHGSVVTDPRCGYGIGIRWRGDGRFSRLNEMVDRSQSLENPVMVRIRVTGVMRRDTEPRVGMRAWSLDLTDAEVLGVQRIPEADAERYLSWLEGPSPAPFRPSR